MIDKLRILVPFLLFSQLGIIYADNLPSLNSHFPCKGIVSLKNGAERELNLISMNEETLIIEGVNTDGKSKHMNLPLKMISNARCLTSTAKSRDLKSQHAEKPKKMLTKLLIMTEPREAFVRLDTAENFEKCPCTLDSMSHDKKYSFEARLNDKHFQWYREQYYTPKYKAVDTLYIKLKPSRPLWIIKTTPTSASLYSSNNFSLAPLSKSPAQIEPKLPGYTQIHIQKEGYKDTVLNVSIPPFRPLISEIKLTKLNENTNTPNLNNKKRWGKNLQKISIPLFLVSLTTLYLIQQSHAQLISNQKDANRYNLGRSNYIKLKNNQTEEFNYFNQNIIISSSAGSIASLLLAIGLYLEYDF